MLMWFRDRKTNHDISPYEYCTPQYMTPTNARTAIQTAVISYSFN